MRRGHQSPLSPEAPYPYGRVALAVWVGGKCKVQCQASPGWGQEHSETLKRHRRRQRSSITIVRFVVSLITAAIVANYRNMT